MDIISAFLGAFRWFLWAFFKGGITLVPALIGAFRWFVWAIFATIGFTFNMFG